MSDILDNTVTVSIVTYNSQYIFKTLDSFIDQKILTAFPVKILVHDNGSDDTYITKLQKYASADIQIIADGKNLGFGHGHNANLAIAQTRFFVVCNPDIIINYTAFQKMFQLMTSQPETSRVAMLTPKIVGPDGSVQHLVRHKLDVFDYMLRFVPFGFVKRLFAKRLADYECRNLSDDRQVIQYGSGAFMFLQTAVINKIEGFDEHFFMYFEDNDLCDRINQTGYQIMYVPDATVTHFYGMASHRSLAGFKIFMKSMIQYFNKWGWRFF